MKLSTLFKSKTEPTPAQARKTKECDLAGAALTLASSELEKAALGVHEALRELIERKGSIEVKER